MNISRTYHTWDMGFVSDSVEEWDGLHYFVFVGTVPAWFTPDPFYSGSTEQYPTFSFNPPQGTAGSFIFGVQKYTLAGVLVDVGVISINVQAFTQSVWNVDGCYTANIVWFDPSGGWESYLFVGKQQTFQDKGTESTFINSDNEKRFQRKDEIHQGVMITTGKVPTLHADYIGDAFKAIQAYLWTAGNGFEPIIITSRDFKRPKSGDAYSQYDVEFRYAIEDIIQTQ